MANPRPQQLTVDNNIVEVLETTTVDFIAVNSGTCTGDFNSNRLNTNTISATGTIVGDHLVANSGTLAVKLTTPSFQANTGVYLTSLTVSGLPVRIDSLGVGSGITAIVQDTAPVLGGNLNANSNNISAINALTANTGNFPISCTAGSFNGNTLSLALSATADHLIANSGTLSAKLITQNVQASTGTFSSSLTVSGIPVTLAPQILTYYFIAGTATASVNATAAPQLYNGTIQAIQQVDLSNCKEVRLDAIQIVAGAAGCRFACNGKTGSFSSTVGNYTTICTAGVNGNLSIEGTTANAHKDTGWLPLLPAFQKECFLAVVVSGGNGTADPSFSIMKISAR